MMKRCNKCGVEKLSSMFYTEPRTGAPRSRCIDCYNLVRKPKKFVRRPWSEAEDDILQREYPEGGWEVVAALLAGRDRRTIQNRAWRLGVHQIRPEAPTERLRRGQEPPFGVPADDRPEEIKALDYALRDFRECEPAANLVASLGVVHEVA